MKTKRIFLALSLIVSVGLLTQCEKYGDHGGPQDPDPDSDRPAWAGGNTDENPHNKGNDDSGTTKGGDYGDLYILARDVDGVPDMVQVVEGGEWFVQPITEGGLPVELNEEGEVVNPEEAQEVEFGRLNIVRSPPSVLNQAFDEAMKVLTAPEAVITLDFCGRLTSTYPDGAEVIVKTIDSPRENMAIYKEIMNNLFTGELAFLETLGYDPLTIAASCFAAGSDKTGTVDEDEVVYINGFMDCIGLNAIPNEHENKYYFNFSEPMEDADPFQYNRGVYEDRWLKTVTLNGDGTYTEVIETVWDAMESRGLFTEAWPGDDVEYLVQVEGFAWAVDDAVQVLDFVHGDSNIEFLPDGPPPTP